MRRSLTLLTLMLLMTGSTSAFAHQKKEAITEILFNTRSGNLEVMHRYLMHDAEHAVRVLVDPDADIIASEEARQAFAQYATERFALLGDDGDTLKLQFVGQEVDGVFLWVYQEMPLPTELHTLGVIDNVLRELWPEQNNLVNIERDGNIQSLNFNGNTEWLSVNFDD
ncbi:MAG: hypothetical protein KDI28_06475 [Pseudomonadales bacterium]|nr:hypothetical protein [Pseudomonadales bacterium]MCP5358552.1 hypothetical protein [Pseudomonadales bacterium]